ncbi:hypothetical protein [Cohnella sp. AR92]|uniref:hypothetical protein n=1 Tax=Cohnella sp. AR92 TaxID=648716 RepID=UPI000F8E0106|nr:hypothetical protein [Cohnella sp. AR92]RUS45519.1 hypothetical protein ELR57_19395 [Cohnella sp. AR92]
MPLFRSGKKPQPLAELATVESQRNEIIPEEFPEGPYGMSLESPSLGKSTPWGEGQRSASAFAWENRELHAGLDRDYPGDHKPDDEADPEMH